MRRMGHLRFILSVLIVTALLWSHPHPARAIPAFARAQHVSCSLCHTGFPKLNHFGVEFMLRGYRMPAEEGKFLWDQPFPISGRVDLSYQSQNTHWHPETNVGAVGFSSLLNTKKSSFGLDDWQLLAGGTLAPRLSFFGEIVGVPERLGPNITDPIKTNGPSPVLSKPLQASHSGGIFPDNNAPTTEADTLKTEIQTEAFFLQFDDLLPDSEMNLRVGKYHVDSHFLSSRHRLTQADYLIQIQTILGPTLQPTSEGVELNGSLPTGTHYFAGVRNYGPAYDSKQNHEQRVGATYVLVNQTILGHMDEGQTVSFMASTDRAGSANCKPGDPTCNPDDGTLSYGASLDLHFGDLNIIPGIFRYRQGADIRNGKEMNVTSGTTEAVYPIRSSLLGIVRYDFYNRNLENDSLDRKAHQIVAALAWYPQPLWRLVLEYSRLTARNLILGNLPEGLILVPTSTKTNLTQTIISLALQVGF